MSNDLPTNEELESAWKILRDSGAYMHGHFFLPKTGKHCDEFFQMAKALQHSEYARTLCVILARILRRAGILHRIENGKRFTIVAPVDAGIPVAFWVGENLDADRILWMSKPEDMWEFRPLVTVDENDMIMLVDDSILSGKTIRGILKALMTTKAQTFAVAAILDQRPEKTRFNDLPLYTVIKAESSPFNPDQCPMCKKGKELTEIRLK